MYQIKSLTFAACIRICFSTEDQASILTRPLRVRHGLNPDSDSEFGVEGNSEFGVAGNATEFGVEANAAFEVEGIAAFGIATELGVAGNATFWAVVNAAFEVEGNAVEFVVVGNAKPSPEAPKINKKIKINKTRIKSENFHFDFVDNFDYYVNYEDEFEDEKKICH